MAVLNLIMWMFMGTWFGFVITTFFIVALFERTDKLQQQVIHLKKKIKELST